MKCSLSGGAPAFLVPLLLLGCASSGPAGESALAPLEEPIRVLILGDSISMAYTEGVRHLLGERAAVFRPVTADGSAANCQGTNHGIRNIDRWLAIGGGGWDVIHFNFGLHDLKRVDAGSGKNSNDPADSQQADPERYEQQLRRIVATLQETGARLVFATTTPVPSGGVRPHRDPGDVLEYNRIGRRVMSDAGVAVNDLFAFALPRLAEIQQPENVHFTEAGSETLAGQVAAAILAVARLPRESRTSN